MFKTRVSVFLLPLLAGGLLHADFGYLETTKVTGGSLLKMMRWVPGGSKSLTEPTESAVYLKGNRMATLNKKSGQIVDLDKETITNIDFEKQTYSVMTFAEMAQMMAEMQKAAQQRMAEAEAKQRSAARQMEDSRTKMDMKVDVKETGMAKNVNGLDTKEFIMTIETLVSAEAQTQQGPAPMAMATKIVSDMWMTPQLPGYEEMLEFQKRMAAKMATSLMPSMSPMMFQQRGSSELYKKMAEEGAKLKGTPVLTVTRMMGPGGVGGPGGPGGEGPDMGNVSDAARQQAARDAESAAARQASPRRGAGFRPPHHQPPNRFHRFRPRRMLHWPCGRWEFLPHSDRAPGNHAAHHVVADQAGFRGVQPGLRLLLLPRPRSGPV